jgi:peptide deformylase
MALCCINYKLNNIVVVVVVVVILIVTLEHMTILVAAFAFQRSIGYNCHRGIRLPRQFPPHCPAQPTTAMVAHFSRTRRGRLFTPTWLLDALSAREETEVDPGVVEGTDLRILKYPHAALRAPNAVVTLSELEDGSIAKLAREMFLVMYAAQGVGLAAAQVGINKRLMVYNESGDRTKWLNEVILVNPTITEFSDTTDIETEGCLSFPNMNGSVQRSKWIKVEAMNLKGKVTKKKFKGYEARIFQHEYDHLDGIVYIDRLADDESKANVAQRLEELIQEHDSATHGEPAL